MGAAPGPPLSRLQCRAARKAAATCPVVLVVHENRGLNDHIRDVARRLARGRLFGGRARFPEPRRRHARGDEDRARTMIGALDMAETVADGAAMIGWLASPRGRLAQGRDGRLLLGRRHGEPARGGSGDALKAGVSFYGPAPDPAEAARVEAAMLIILAGLRRAGQRDRPALGRRRCARPARTVRGGHLSRTSTTPSTTTRRRRATIARRPTRPGRRRSSFFGAAPALRLTKKARRFRRAFPVSVCPPILFAAAHEAQQEQEHVDEVEIERQRAHDRGLAEEVGARRAGNRGS